MSVTEHPGLIQGSDEWLEQRRGMVTASVVGQLISIGAPSAITVLCPECGAEADAPCVSRSRKEPTPIKTLHGSRMIPEGTPPVITPAQNDTSRALTLSLVAERITGWTESVYVNNDMLRGTLDEPIARDIYAAHYAPVRETGFIVRDEGTWCLGYSPDGLVGDDGLVEVKSRRSKAQVLTILSDQVPTANMAQLQAGLLVTGRQWIDYVSYSSGMHLYVKRVYPDPAWHGAIVAAVENFEDTAQRMAADYMDAVEGLPLTERVDHFAEIEF